MSVKYRCECCETGCTIEPPSDKYEPIDCPSYSGISDWRKVREENATKNVGGKA